MATCVTCLVPTVVWLVWVVGLAPGLPKKDIPAGTNVPAASLSGNVAAPAATKAPPEAPPGEQPAGQERPSAGAVATAACCDDATGTCYDQFDTAECTALGWRYELGIEFCADLDPPCGLLVAACCCGPAGELGICEAFECLGDLTAAACLGMGEETAWYAAETCAGPAPFECNAPTYCEASGGYCCDEYIARVQLGNINQSSGQDYYADYTDLYTYLFYGTDYTITVTNDDYWFTDITTVWIDWNQDKDFYDAGEQVASGDPGGLIFTGTFQVEAGALEGPTRMRVRIQYGGTPDPCGTTSYGEVEDYTVIVGAPPPYGACCVGEACFWDDDPPMDEAACLALGGLYHGDGTSCTPGACVGACCYPDESCSDGSEAECPGDYQGGGTTCATTVCPPAPPGCPPPSLYAAPPHLPDEGWTFAISDEDQPFIRVDNFFCVYGAIEHVRWWGAELDDSLANCTRYMNTYEIKFYVDAGGVPGAQLCDTYTVFPERTFTGLLYDPPYNVRLYRYDAELPISCPRHCARCWMSIVGVDGMGCRFWWASTAVGDAFSCGGPDFGSLACGGNNNFDLAMCQTGFFFPEWGSCCWDSVICGDFDNNGVVDGADYWIFAGALPSCSGDPGYVAAADLDGDGCVTLADYAEWLLCYQGWTGYVCDDNFDPEDCCAMGGRYSTDTLCAELDPPCGQPGACCDEFSGECLDDVYAANCYGRHALGQPCNPDPFEPPCGELRPTGLLYAPTEADNPAFRSQVAAILGEPVDYYDAREGTPTLELMLHYRAVMTWVNYWYDDVQLMGERLADYVDLGGKVILGQWAFAGFSSSSPSLPPAKILEPEYCPVAAVWTSYGSGAYNGDGVDCVHRFEPVFAYSADYLDVVSSTTPEAGTDGTFSTGTPAVIWRPDRLVYYSPGNTGGTYSTGDWAQLTANMCVCTDGPMIGACCDEPNQVCYDNMMPADCTMPGKRFLQGGACADFDPSCGQVYGACCHETECLYQRPSECTGAYQGNGIPCEPDPCLCAAFFVDAPGTWIGNTTGAGDDCALRTGADQIWAVTIPYASTWAFSLCSSSTVLDTYMFVGTTCCGQEVGYNNNDCYYLKERSALSEVRGDVGPGTYYVDIEPYSSTATGPYTLHVFDVYGACCDDFLGSCNDGTLIDNCDPPLRFEGGTPCAELNPECVGVPGACCVGSVCVGTMTSTDCDVQGGDWFVGEDCTAGFECPSGCEHSITMWDDYGDGWNNGYIDVYVNGWLHLAGVTLDSGYGPETVTFLANTDDTIHTVWTPGGWPYEASYCIYDGLGGELGCDGQGGVEPSGITVSGSCGTPKDEWHPPAVYPISATGAPVPAPMPGRSPHPDEPQASAYAVDRAN